MALAGGMADHRRDAAGRAGDGGLPARAAEEVPLADAIFNVQHVALLLSALQSGKARTMREALQDRAHQPYREPLVPGLRRLLALRHPDVIGVCLSGAGPTVAVFASRNAAKVEEMLRAAYAKRAGAVHGEDSESSSGR